MYSYKDASLGPTIHAVGFASLAPYMTNFESSLPGSEGLLRPPQDNGYCGLTDSNDAWDYAWLVLPVWLIYFLLGISPRQDALKPPIRPTFASASAPV
jgi:hypothetical protein